MLISSTMPCDRLKKHLIHLLHCRLYSVRIFQAGMISEILSDHWPDDRWPQCFPTFMKPRMTTTWAWVLLSVQFCQDHSTCFSWLLS